MSKFQIKSLIALSPEEQTSFVPIVSDFVIELRSSSDTLNSLQEKMQEYQEYIEQGVQLELLIDRKNHNVYVYRLNLVFNLLKNPEVVNCEPELLGFELMMAKIW